MLELLNQIISRADRSEPLAVCLLVRTRGSTPQKAGAMMLVLADGKTLGTIGGGCVEAEVRTRALQAISGGESRLFTFQLNHDLGWDDGLVCGGSVDVAMQIIRQPSNAQEYRQARDELAAGRSAKIQLTVLDDQARPVSFEQAFHPPPTLVIAGAGHVGAALASIARLMDFSLVVIDDRPDYASSERFPGADCRIGAVEAELSGLTLNEHSYIVIVTRGHRRDGLALSAVIRSPARYIGLIGSKRKIVQIFRDLRDEGVSPENLRRVHAPIGLDIGAITPAEIATSIAAELIAVRRNAGDALTQSMQLSAEQLDRVLRGT